jgi:flagellin
MSTISLSAGVRTALSSILQTNQQAEVAQLRLATGKKVNSAIDNPQNFFVSQGLNARAGDLGNLLDQMGQGLKVIEAADKGIKGITKLVETARGLANSAKQLAATDATGRAALAAQYNTIRAQITDLASDAGYNGLNLIKNTPDTLTVQFSEADATNNIAVAGVALDDAGLALTAAAGNWATNANADTDIALLDTALLTLRSTAATLGANSSIIKVRADFTRGIMDTLRTGSDALVLADPNEEGANLISLNTRGQLAQTSLQLATQRDQAVLRLF